MFKLLLNRKINLIALIVLVHLVFSYYYFPRYYSSAIGTLLIVFLSWLVWKKEALFWIGLQLNRKKILLTLLAFAVFLVGSYFVIKLVALKTGIQVFPGNYKNFVHTLFYTLNEEIILGALLLKGIKGTFKKSPDWMISAGVALIFMLIHLAFFKWIFHNRGDLALFTLISLFAVGVFRNNLILKTGHIGYSWAIHFAWIYIMLGSHHFIKAQTYYLNDFERFELYLGDVRISAICVALAILSFMHLPKAISS